MGVNDAVCGGGGYKLGSGCAGALAVTVSVFADAVADGGCTIVVTQAAMPTPIPIITPTNKIAKPFLLDFSALIFITRFS